jgi:ribosomal protein S27AE
MKRYSCPICSENVPPVAFGRTSDGEIVPRANGLLIETRQCPRCGEFLERTPLDRWHTAGSIELARDLEISEFR